MRTICDACESAAAIVFWAANEAALCHLVMRRSICATNLLADMYGLVLQIPAKFPDVIFVKMHQIDGSSLCLQCHVIVHVGGKRIHGRYLVQRQRVEFSGDKPGNLEDPAAQPMDLGESRRGQNQQPKMTSGENQQNHRVSPVPISDTNADGHAKRDNKMIDLNIKPHRMHGQASKNQDQ